MESATGETSERQTILIEPRPNGLAERLREIWKYRSLLRFFGRRAKNKLTTGTLLGRGWLVLRPLLDVGTKALIFGGLLGAPSGGKPYFLFFLFGMAAWRLFDNALNWATRSLELNRGVLEKLYVPRLLLPVASTSPALIEFAVYVVLCAAALAGFAATSGVWHLELGPNLLAALAALALCLAFAIGISLFLSVPAAKVRDVRYSLRYATEFWFLITPVIYPLSAVPGPYNAIAQVNPMTPVLELFKWGTLGSGQIDSVSLSISVGVIMLTFLAGLWFFSRAEATAVDRL